jgi:hypothetical protein
MTILSDILSEAQSHWHILVLALATLHFVRNRYQKGLSQIPGPWLNSISTLPRMWSVYRGRHHLEDLKLHRRYGKVVRMAPNLISISDTNEINQIYGISAKFFKAPFYDLSAVHDEEGLVPDPFVIRQDKALHARMKRNAANAYSMDGLIQFEPWINDVLDRLLVILNNYASNGTVCDFGYLLKMFAMDAVTRLTLGNDFGYIEKGDHHRIFPVVDLFTNYMSIVCATFPPLAHTQALTRPLLLQ